MSDILHNPCKEMWENAKDFKQLQNAMVEYLEGRCPNNPWMVDKIEYWIQNAQIKQIKIKMNCSSQ